MKLKLPFGIKNNKLVEVAEVEKGIACNCFCPNCGHPLVARKGDKTIHHFAHDKSAECSGSLETALHMAAKEILDKNKKIRIPSVIASLGNRSVKLYSNEVITFDKVFLEKRFGDIVPDIIVEKNGKQFFIEIVVSHYIDNIKLEKIKKLNISTLEIDLSMIDKQITFEYLEKILLEELVNKEWIYNSKTINFINKIKKLSKNLKVYERNYALHVDYCPLKSRIYKGKPYANLTDDCDDCGSYFCETKNRNYISCFGGSRDEIDKIINTYNKKS